jgi:hypothetical protein
VVKGLQLKTQDSKLRTASRDRLTPARRILIGVIAGIILFVAGTWLLSKVLGNNQPYRFHGQTLDYWSVQASARDVAASNQANTILNQEIIPQLRDQMFHDTNDSKIRLATINALDRLPWVPLIDYSQAPMRRAFAAYELGAFGPAGSAAIPALMQAVRGADPSIQENAIKSLGQIHSQPDVVIPFLTKYLDDDNLDDDAAIALSGFGSLARPAVPKIIPLLNAPDKDAQVAARCALQIIDPTALTNVTAEVHTNYTN